jgi:hypothetical protein
MPPTSPQEYLQRINTIMGVNAIMSVADTDSDIRMTLDIRMDVRWSDRREAQAVIARLRQMQTELRFLKQQVGADASAIRSEFTSRRTAVGKSVPNIVAGVIFGRRNVGRGTALQRDILRRGQLDALAPYEKVKRVIDAVVHALNEAKGRIETSDEYRSK